MFEFHGWATIRFRDRGASYGSIGRGPQYDALKRLRQAVNEANDEFCDFDIRRAGNGLVALAVHGLRNHRYQPVIELFGWVAVEFPDAYGLLYIYDDEDADRGADYSNEFRVWRMARGRLEEMADPFLSPYFPTVESSSDDGEPA